MLGVFHGAQEEMQLANELGDDRDGMEGYLSAIDQIQARKIDLISKLNQVRPQYHLRCHCLNS
jgi:hypothetical protein